MATMFHSLLEKPNLQVKLQEHLALLSLFGPVEISIKSIVSLTIPTPLP